MAYYYSNDPELLEEANKNDCRIDEIWAEKQADKEKNYSWSTLADLYDCLSKPCQYTNMISPSIGTIGDNQPKYNLKNTSGSDEATTLLGIPAYMINKMPRYLLQGITQLTDMISLQSSDIFNKILGSKKLLKRTHIFLKMLKLLEEMYLVLLLQGWVIASVFMNIKDVITHMIMNKI